ncbi:hypothetical protein ERO13_D13G094925v2 [Gossypium hirsutum]|nr:hypothetical protein ERO13_D13G094925v2 [Gossypium hirsutum]
MISKTEYTITGVFHSGFKQKILGISIPFSLHSLPIHSHINPILPSQILTQKHSMAAISCFLRLRHSSPSSKVRIGSGSFGEIYLGTNLQTNEEVAIKFCVIASSSSLACLIASSTHS